MRKLHLPRTAGISLSVIAVVGSLMVVPATIASAEAPASSDYDCFPINMAELQGDDGMRVVEGMDRLWIEVKGRGGDPTSSELSEQLLGRAASIHGWYPVVPGDAVTVNHYVPMVSVNHAPVAVAGSGGSPGWFYSSAGGAGNAGGDAGVLGETARPGEGTGAGSGAEPLVAGIGGQNPPAASGADGASLQGGWGGYNNDSYATGNGGTGGNGYYGGGGGAAGIGPVPGAGGGGGSSYVAEGFEVAQNELVGATTDDSVQSSVSVEQCGPRVTVDPERAAAIEAAGYQCLVPVAFEYMGARQEFTVPADATVALIDTYGASGGSYSVKGMGLGGMTSAVVAVTPGETLEVNVGGRGVFYTREYQNPMPIRIKIEGGFNGGGGVMLPQHDDSQGSTGGGGSDVRKAPFDAASRMVVGGGGGGGGGTGESEGGVSDTELPGGHGGKVGGDGVGMQYDGAPADVIVYGTGATATLPGKNGIIHGQNIPGYGPVLAADGNEPSGISGGNFYFIPAPTVNEFSYDDGFAFASGGGGGWFGGGAGGGYLALDYSGRAEGSAGGGSSYAIAGPSGLPETLMESGVRRGDGLVYITTCAKIGGGGSTPVDNGSKGPQNIAATGSTTPGAAIWAAAAASLLGTALVLSARRRRS